MNRTHLSVTSPFAVLLSLGTCVLGWADQPSTGVPVSQADVQAMILSLGDEEFRVRESASEQLIQMGVAAIPQLRSADRHYDREVRYRCEQILRVIVLTDRQARIDTLLSGESQSVPDLPGWERFRDAVGDSSGARELFVEMLKSEWDLLDHYDHPTGTRSSIQNELANRCLAIKETQPSRHRSIALGTILTVLFLASEDGIVVPDVTGQHIYSMLYQTPFRSSMTQRDRKDVMRTVLGRWIERENGPWTMHYALTLSLEYGLVEGLTPATRAINLRDENGEPALASHIRRYGVLVIAKMGGPDHFQMLSELFDDDTVCLRQQIGKMTFQTQIRDIALAARIYLEGENPKDFGFERIQRDQRSVFKPSSIGFSNDGSRTAAFQEWEAWRQSREISVSK